MKLLARLNEVGVKAHYPEYLKTKIRLSNNFVLIGFLVALGYTLAYMFFLPEVMVYTIAAVAGMLLGLVFNHFGLHVISRFELSIIPCLVVAVIQGYAVGADEPSLNSFVIFMCVTPIIPWVLFDVREKWYLVGAVVVNFAVILSLSWFNRTFETEGDTSLFQNSTFDFILSFSGLFTAGLLLYILMRRYVSFENKNTELVVDLEKQREAMREQQANLEVTLKEVDDARKEEKNRAWIGNANGRINDLLRNAPTLNDLYPQLIKEWVITINGFQGVLYIREQDEETNEVFMNLAASYAVSRDDNLPPRVSDGEGQLGMAVIKKEMLILDDLPEGHVHVKSGLGKTKARQIVVCPLVGPDRVEGVLEIAGLEVFSQRSITYLRESARVVAATVQNLHTNDNTRRLLAMSQQQAEELRTQEEEMRQNMEELQATQEEMRRKEQEYVNTIQELRNILTEKMYGKKDGN